MNQFTKSDVFIDKDSYEEARQILIERYQKAYGKQVEQQVDLLMELDGYIDRFNYFFSVMGDRVKALSKVMISGYSAGSEMIVARNFGFQEIYGVEVDSSLHRAACVRFGNLPGMFPELYDGSTLPYSDGQFDLVVSGHIIEHTQSPRIYLSELIRVLKAGGILFIEYPSRYHYIELHTGLFSFEWLPASLRNFVLRTITSRSFPLKSNIKSRYASILKTGLQQVSRRDIFQLLHLLNIEYKELAHAKPARGIDRCIIQFLGKR